MGDLHSFQRPPANRAVADLDRAPELHHWHHDHARDAGNYANPSLLMDLLFGTYTCPNDEPRAFGIAEPIPRSYLGQMLYPFLPRTRKAAVDEKKLARPAVGEALSDEHEIALTAVNVRLRTDQDRGEMTRLHELPLTKIHERRTADTGRLVFIADANKKRMLSRRFGRMEHGHRTAT